ncbi:MAG TPA: MFS transporter [Pseudonocardiaceae bacterium]
MVRQVLTCAFLTEAVPLFSLYSLLFASSGLSGAQISALFVIWCVTGILTQVPTGALADRFSRRYCVAAAGLLQAGGYAIWTLFPHFAGFAAGFVGWGIGGSLFSGALEALLYDGLAAHDAQEQYARVWGWEIATGLLAQAPAAGAATLLYHLGGFTLVGWVSTIGCLCGGLAALRIPESPHATEPSDSDDLGYLATLRLGAREAMHMPRVRLAILAVAALVAFDGTEEYFPLLANDWGVPTGWVPLAVVGIPLLAAGAAALSGRANRLRPRTLAVLLAIAFTLFGIAGLVRAPIGLAAVALGYGLYRLVEVVANARLQDRIDGAQRATVTSIAGLGGDLSAIALYAVWPLGQLVLVAALGIAVAVALPRWLRE